MPVSLCMSNEERKDRHSSHGTSTGPSWCPGSPNPAMRSAPAAASVSGMSHLAHQASPDQVAQEHLHVSGDRRPWRMERLHQLLDDRR
jgi:hypothetical protein